MSILRFFFPSQPSRRRCPIVIRFELIFQIKTLNLRLISRFAIFEHQSLTHNFFCVPICLIISQPASSSQCLTSPPQSPLPQPPSQLLLRPIQTAITPTGDANGSPQTVEATATPSVVDLEESVATMTLEVEQNDCQESTVEAIPLPDAVPVDVEETEQISLAPKMTAESTPTTTVTPPATTISTNCTPSYSRTHNNAAGSASTNESKEESKSGVAVTNGRPVVQQPFNRNHSNNNSQGDPRSSSTTIVSPLNTTTSYQVHAVGQSQYVAHPSVRHDEQIHGRKIFNE